MTNQPHTKFVTELRFGLMLKEYTRIPFWRFLKKGRQWKQITEFASQHKDCCGIEQP